MLILLLLLFVVTVYHRFITFYIARWPKTASNAPEILKSRESSADRIALFRPLAALVSGDFFVGAA